MILRTVYNYFVWGGGEGASEQELPEWQSKSEGEELDLQANPVEDSLNDFESDWMLRSYDLELS